MERYSNSTREVAQDGRRGALMLSLSIKHPDAERFIDAKVDTGKVTGANVSIKIDDEFMRAAIAGKKYHQQFPINSDNPRYEQDIDARKLWDKIIHNAWKSAEPGVLFWDTIIRESVPDCLSLIHIFGMILTGEHLAHHHARKAALDGLDLLKALDLESDVGQYPGNLFGPEIGVDVAFEPVIRNIHIVEFEN